MAKTVAALILSFIPVISGVQFIALGDWGSERPADIDKQKLVAQRMSEWCSTHTCDFIFSTGDNFYPRGVLSVTDSKFNSSWTEIYDIYPSLANKVWYQSIGNHDHDDYDVRPPPGDGRELYQVLYGRTEPRWVFPGRWYDFVVNDPRGFSVHFIVLDSQSLKYNINSPPAQLNWLESTLAGSTSEWKVVVIHHPPYSAGNKGSVEPSIDEQVMPIVRRHPVQLMLTGHDHNLQHISNNTDINDIHFVISGAGGRYLYPYNATAAVELQQRGFVIDYFGETHGFTDLNFSAEQLTVSHINDNGDIVHSFSRSVETGNKRPLYSKH